LPVSLKIKAIKSYISQEKPKIRSQNKAKNINDALFINIPIKNE